MKYICEFLMTAIYVNKAAVHRKVRRSVVKRTGYTSRLTVDILNSYFKVNKLYSVSICSPPK
jgi:hypothetical protein